jgi:hypothetical protein
VDKCCFARESQGPKDLGIGLDHQVYRILHDPDRGRVVILCKTAFLVAFAKKRSKGTRFVAPQV